MAKRTSHHEQTRRSEEEKDALRARSNPRISQCCNYAALLIILVTFASYILGHADGFFFPIGIMASIALLAIAAVNNPSRK